MKEISVLAPATVSNVVCGFDCLGFALEAPCDEMTVRLIDEKTVRIINHDQYNLPTEAEKNVAGVALLAMLDAIEEHLGFEVEITKHIKPGSGIGSSAASAVGAVVGGKSSFRRPVFAGRTGRICDVGRIGRFPVAPRRQRRAVSFRRFHAGSLGRIRSTSWRSIFRRCLSTVIHPQIEIKTSDAREILPRKRSARRARFASGAISARSSPRFAKGDYELISRSLEDFINRAGAQEFDSEI